MSCHPPFHIISIRKENTPIRHGDFFIVAAVKIVLGRSTIALRRMQRPRRG